MFQSTQTFCYSRPKTIPAVLCGCEGKLIKEILIIPWTVRRMNPSVANQIMIEYSLESWAAISKVKYCGHNLQAMLLLLLNELTEFLSTGMYMSHITENQIITNKMKCLHL